MAHPTIKVLAGGMIALGLILNLSVETQAQNDGQKSPFKVNLVPPSPEAAALAKYADIPVSLYSGVPSIEIPIYAINERDLSLPVSVSYHASGNKVGAEATRTGLGWSLNAGGVISRATRGWPDEFTSRGFLYQAQQREIGDFAIGVRPAADQYQWYHDMATGCMDIEPDVFFFNFGNYSGKFMFNWDGQIETASSNSLKISPIEMNPGTNDFIDGWEVITEDGTTYVFDVIESIKTTSPSSSSISCQLTLQNATVPSSWYLREIRSAKQQTWIRLEYESYSQVTKMWSQEIQTHNQSLNPAVASKEQVTQNISGKQVSKITTSSGLTTVNFVSGSQRSDVSGNCYTLEEISVYNNRHRLIADWRFDYDYSTGRLTLRKITEMSGTQAKPPYEFYYHSEQLPFSDSFAQDHWGFYNRNAANTLIPSMDVVRPIDNKMVSLSGANREPNSGVYAGMLQKIVYPTGGTDVLEFEPHDYSFHQNEELRKEVVIPRQHSVFAPKESALPGEYSTHRIDFNLPTDVDTIRILATFTYGMTFGSPSHPVTLKLINRSTNEELLYLAPGGAARIEGDEIIPEEKSFSPKIVNVPAGDYALIATGRKSANPSIGQNAVTATVAYDEQTGQIVTEIRQGGGLRIKKVTRSFGNGNPDNVTVYSYRMNENNEEKSSGSLLESGYKYADWMQYAEPGTVYTSQIVTKFIRYAHNKSALGTTQGSHVGYQQVTVRQGVNGENGKTVYTYQSPRQVPDYATNEIPYPPPVSYDFMRGLLMTKTDFDAAGKPLKKVSNQYSFKSTNIFALKTGFRIPGEPPYGPGYLERYALGNYQNVLGYPRLTQSKEESFFGPDPVESIEQTSKFFYNEHPDHRQLTLTVTTDSENDSVYTKTTYPQDYPAGNSVLDFLKTRHQVNLPVESISWEKVGQQSFLLSALRKEYAIHNNMALQNGLKGARISNPIPASDPLAAAQALYENRLRYTQFDAYGNVTEHTLDDGLFTSYVWGEKGSVILAKADHATVRQIYHTSFEEDANATLNNAKTGSRSFIVVGNYTVPSAALPTVPGNYILSYWTWTSAGNFWEYKEKRINNYQPGTAIVSDPISSGYIDEVRLFPAGAVMTTYTHEPLVGVTSITDANNVTTYYEYDSFNRLKCKRDQDRNILETYDYTFQQSVPFAVGNN